MVFAYTEKENNSPGNLQLLLSFLRQCLSKVVCWYNVLWAIPTIVMCRGVRSNMISKVAKLNYGYVYVFIGFLTNLEPKLYQTQAINYL